MVTYSVGTANSTWSLGFQETEPGVWKVNRITPVSMTGRRGFDPPITVFLENRGQRPR